MILHTVQPEEVDVFGYLKPSDLLRHCTASCSEQNAADGCDEAIHRIVPVTGWMIARFCMTQSAPIRTGEELVLRCSPRSIDGAVYIRSVRVHRDDVEVASCDFVWTLVDMENRRILRAKEIDRQLDLSAPIELPSVPRLPREKDLPELSRQIISHDVCDANGHYSSANYVDMLCDAFDFWKDGARLMRKLQIEYKGEFMPGEELILYGRVTEEGVSASGAHADGRSGFAAYFVTEQICF